MLESIILGAVQGVAEWLPISSEAMVILVKHNFFSSGMDLSAMIDLALFLHLGTLLSVLVYFRKRVKGIVIDLLNFKALPSFAKKELSFLALATLVSGVLGLVFLKLLEQHDTLFAHHVSVNIFVAVFLLITALLLFLSEQQKKESSKELSLKKAFITGIFQSCAALPGISRSGSTIAAMGLLGIEKKKALELSFLLSIPLVVGANIVLNLSAVLTMNFASLCGLLAAFLCGLVTIELLMKLVERIRFSGFVAFFALLLIIFSLFL